MKILHLCYYYGNNTSGAPIAATRLHQALLRAGVESHYICVECKEPGVNIHLLPKSWIANRLFYVAVRMFWVLTKAITGRMLMPNIFPLPGLSRTVCEIAPDVIHVQYIGQDMMSFAQLASLPQPKVFTLHDMSIVNAIDPYPWNDIRFAAGFCKRNSTLPERWMFARKMKFVMEANMEFSGPSDWICGLFARSLIANGRKAQMIPNIIDPAYNFDVSLRTQHDKFTISFGAYGGRRSPYKGWPDLSNALALLPETIRRSTKVAIFGERAEDCVENGVKICFLGEIEDPSIIRKAHHSSDLFALPSRQDNAPQVKFEALADGLPVVAFERTGCAEWIRTGENGWVARDGDIAGFAKGIEYFYRLWLDGTLEKLHAHIAQETKKSFSEDAIVGKFIEMYRKAATRCEPGAAENPRQTCAQTP